MLRRIVPLILVLMLVACMIPIQTRAAEYTFEATAGETAYFVMFSDATDLIENAYIYDGSIPGMWLEVSGDVTLGLAGTPTTAGTFKVMISATTSKLGEMTIIATVKVSEKAASGTPVVTKNPTDEKVVETESVMFIARADNVRQYVWEIAIADAELECSELKSYLGENIKVVGENTDTLVIYNVSKKLDGAYVWCRFVGAEESVKSSAAKLSVTAMKDAKPEVTKDPTDETVDEGGETTFAADAKYTQKYQWQLVSPGGTVYDAEKAQKEFSTLKITGADTKKLVLKNIPAELDGFQVFCKFTAGETVSGKKATLHVIPKPTEPPTEAPTEPPTEAPTEAPTQAPTQEATEAEILAPTEQIVPTQAAEDGNSRPQGSRYALAITLVIAVAAVLICAILAFVVFWLKGSKRH